MAILFCNIGWMEFYKGQLAGDRIKGGGSYVQEEGKGHEVCNFVDHDGYVYGYVQPANANRQSDAGQIKVEKLGGGRSDQVCNVLVVWTAKRPEGGTVVVGWYKNATVYRHNQKLQQPSQLHMSNGLSDYRIRARSIDATLMPIDQRTLLIPRQVKGGMGQSNVWYADRLESSAIRSKVRQLVAGNVPRQKPKARKASDPDHNAKVEKAAVDLTWNYYRLHGYAMKSVEKDNMGWDLEATSNKVRLRIEVKGLSGASSAIGLTPNEYKAFWRRSPEYRLAIVTNVLKRPSLSICRYSNERNGWLVEGQNGKSLAIELVESAMVSIVDV